MSVVFLVTAKVSKAKCLVMDAVCLAQNRGLIQPVGSSSYGMYTPFFFGFWNLPKHKLLQIFKTFKFVRVVINQRSECTAFESLPYFSVVVNNILEIPVVLGGLPGTTQHILTTSTL